MAFQVDSNTSAGPQFVSDTSGETHWPVSKIAFGGTSGFTRVDTANPLPVLFFGSDSSNGAFVFNNVGNPLFLAGDTSGTPVDDSNPLPVAIISGAPDSTVTASISGSVTVDPGTNNDVINTAATPFFLSGDTAGTPVDDSNPFPVSIISGAPDSTVTATITGTVTVDLSTNNDVRNTAATPFFLSGDTAGTPVDDSNPFPVTIISGADGNDTTVTVGNDSTDRIGVTNIPGDPLHIASDTAATPVSGANPLPVTLTPSSDSNGLSAFRDASNDTTVALVSGSPVRLYGYYMFNPDTASVVYVHLYNDTAVALGTDADTLVFGLPPLGGANAMTDNGIPFTTGLSVATTASATSSAADAPGTAAIVNLFYKS